jgi:hypothetical protein
MSDNRGDFIAPPWWSTVSGNGDYTKYRTGTSTTYTSPDDIIGRRDATKYKPVTSDPATTVSGAGDLLTS